MNWWVNDDTDRWAMAMKWWWYVQWCYDGIYNVMIMIYIYKWEYIYKTLMVNGMYNEALRRFMRQNEMKKRIYAMSMYIKQNFLKTFIPPPPASKTKERSLLMCFLVTPKDVCGWKRIYCKAGTPTPLLGAPSSHEHRWLPMRLMGPLCIPQPGTSKLSCCTPQLNPEGLHVCLYVGLRSWSSSCCEWTHWQGLQHPRLQVLQTLEETVGELGNWGLGGHGMVEVVKEEGWEHARWLPSRVHKNLPPQIPLWPPLVSPTPLVSSCQSLHFQSLGLLSLHSWHCWSCLKPYKEGGNSQ